MKFLVAIALFLLAVAGADHDPQRTLRKSRFLPGHTYTYDAFFNVTSGVLGLSSQVSASVLRANVKIYAKSETEHILKIVNVRTSGSLSAVEHKYADIELEEDHSLEDKLSAPITFFLDKGKVDRYTLSRKDNLETQKIKRSILRSLEMEIPEDILRKMEELHYANQPIMFNQTQNTDYGVHISNYIITSSPDVEYPKETRVYNISRFDNCEGEWYPGYKMHHNFHAQGCSEVCRPTGEWKDNFYRAGCPSGFEPHHSPVKRTYNHQHSLSLVKDRFTPEMITTVEVHFAKMYDQDMEVLIRYQLHLTDVAEKTIEAESRQQSYTDLHNKDIELNEDEIDRICSYKKSSEAVASAKQLLEEVSDLIVKSEPDSPVGEKIILLRDVLATFTVTDFNQVRRDIEPLLSLKHKSDSKSVARQVWLEILPLVGTHEPVKFIVQYIKEGVKNKDMLLWEAKEMLEALPQNIERPDKQIIKEMEKLLDDEKLWEKSNLLHSAVHLAIGRIIGQVCGNVPILRQKDNIEEQQSWLLKNLQGESPEFAGLVKCPRETVLSIIEKIRHELEKTELPEEIAVYVETLTHTGMEQALLPITNYAHGTAENMKHFSPKHLAFMRTVTVHALHNMVGRHPQKVMEIVLPIFFNDTETPKLRNAAFGVLMRCQPSLALLQRVATYSWFEKSREVGSFVASTLESFGNSTLPCMQLLSHRIKEILPQMKRFNIGVHHAKNHLWTYFDDLRQFGLEGRFEYTPNNESIVPSTLYNALSYTIHSLRDTIFQSSLHIEGLTQKKLFKMFEDYFNLPTNGIKVLDLNDQREIFGEGEDGMKYMKARTVEDLRLVAYHKLFYRSSYHYLDNTGIESALKQFYQIFENYLEKDRKRYSGYLVKLFLPSTYHTKAVAKTLPYPVEFQMRNPIVISLGVKTDESMRKRPTLKNFDLHLKPSIYMAKVITHQMKNMRDCKEVGVYHTHKISMAYPFQVKYNGNKFPDFVFKYKIPEKEKTVLHYFTESGTYAGKKELKSLPFSETSKPIRTLPEPFMFKKEIEPVGMPPCHLTIETEDINLFHQNLPRTPTEALHLIVKNIMNAGWRYKSAVIVLKENRALWTGENEVKFEVEYSHNHFTGQESNLMSPQVRPWPYVPPVSQTSNENSEESHLMSPQVRPWPYVPPVSQTSNENSEESHLMSPQVRPWPYVPPVSQTSNENSQESYLMSPQVRPWPYVPPVSQTSNKNSQRQTDNYRNTQRWGQDYRSSDDATSWRRNIRQSEENEWDKELPPSHSDGQDWSKYMKYEPETFSEFSENAQSVVAIMERMPHINHRLKISVTAEPLSSFASILIDYNHTYAKDLFLCNVEAESKQANEEPFKVAVHHIIGYFGMPNELHYGNKNMWSHVASFRTAIDWPESIISHPWMDAKIIVAGNMTWDSNREILNEQLKENLGEEYFLPETHEECKMDVQDERPLSPNCIKAIREHSAYNKMAMYFKWKQDLPEHFKQYSRNADVYLKHFFFEHLDLESTENEPNKVEVSMQFIDKLVDKPLANIEIKKPTENVTFWQIPIANVQPFSSIYPMHEAALLKFTNNSYPARCVLTDSYVQTYDLVTYPFKAEKCRYVLSAHCTENKNFAILVHRTGRDKEIHIHVADTKITLLPLKGNSREGFPIKHGQNDVRVYNPVILDEDQDIFAYCEWHHVGNLNFDCNVRVVARKAGVNVLYDGKTVKVQVSLRYKGELCGLCSEFDGEEVREFRGMDRCLYTDPADFAYSAAVKRSQCPKYYSRGQRMCENPEFKDWEEDRGYSPEPREPELQRNVVIYRGDEVCFSVRPTPTCQEGVEPTETENQRIGFHCLPKDDLTAKKLISEANWRPLDELRRKSVDHVQTVEVAKKC